VHKHLKIQRDTTEKIQSSFKRSLRRKHENPRKTINEEGHVQKIHSCRELLDAAYPAVKNVDKYVWQGSKTEYLWKYLHASRRSTNILRISRGRIFSHEFKENEKTETFRNNFEIKKRQFKLFAESVNMHSRWEYVPSSQHTSASEKLVEFRNSAGKEQPYWTLRTKANLHESLRKDKEWISLKKVLLRFEPHTYYEPCCTRTYILKRSWKSGSVKFIHIL
jgi:hypothetical protein